VEQGQIAQWLSYAANEVQNGVALARLHFLLGVPCDLPQAQEAGTRSLEFLEEHLTHREWLELDRPTIADCAIFPYIKLAPEGGAALDSYPNVNSWIGRMQGLPGFTAMQGM
jgi:glutathione S-transferase